MPDTAFSLPAHLPQPRWPEAGLAALGLLCACGAVVAASQGQAALALLLAITGGALASLAWSRHRLAAAVAGLLQDARHPAPARPRDAWQPLAGTADGAAVPLLKPRPALALAAPGLPVLP